jgi:hypothetical protein
MRRRPFLRLTALAVVLAAPAPAHDGVIHAELVGRHVWKSEDPDFGGISGIDLAADGVAFIAVSDIGMFWTGRLVRDRLGRVTGVEMLAGRMSRGILGDPMKADRRDAEGVALDPAGGLYVSFEHVHRVSHFSGPDGTEQHVTAKADELVLDGQPWNYGLEALAVAADGGVYAIPERATSRGAAIPVHVLRDGRWSVPFSLAGQGTWSPVGADFGPDGRLYLLERDYWGLVGFMTRLRRLTLDGDVVTADEVLFTSHAGEFDNLEGLAVWTDARGRIRLTAVSDDNFLPVQRTEIVDWRLPE